MAENSKIEWCHHTFSPWIGCQKVSPGCDFCYAEEWDGRFHGGEHFGPRAPRRRTSDANWNKPYLWNREARARGTRYRVFPSLCDPFDNAVPREWRTSFWRVIAQTPDLDWLLLTKRPENIAKMLPPDWGQGWPGVWLGVSVENQKYADHRIPVLLYTPAALRFVSYEPALEEVHFDAFWKGVCRTCGGAGETVGHYFSDDGCGPCDDCCGRGEDIDNPGLDWIIAGGESGKGARPFDIGWARSAVAQCRAANVPMFMKQVGIRPRSGDGPSGPCTGSKAPRWRFFDPRTEDFYDIRHPMGGNSDEWPADLRVREFPAPAATYLNVTEALALAGRDGGAA